MKTGVSALFTVAVAVALVPQTNAFGCKPAEVKGWIAACDSVTGSTKAKCDNRQCHTALHRLVEEETAQCYVESGFGQASDLLIYHEIDAFCHGEGPDPGPKTLPPFTSAPPPTTAPVVTTSPPAPTTAPPTPTTSAPTGPTTPAPTTGVPPATPSITPSPGQSC
jgi:hypothetical protein